jgi:ABC-2 type transport system permease protein
MMPGRSRFGLLLAAGQVRYQVLLLLRSPIGVFTALVVPLMVLFALDVANPESGTFAQLGVRDTDFLVPGMATFAILNACYVNMITSVVLAREGGVLKRLHGTPLPLWAYAVGRLVAAAVVGVASVVVLFAVGALFMDLRVSAARVLGLTCAMGLGIAAFSVLGMAVSTVVPRTETALPVAYGTLLPIAFVSDVFFPGLATPGWLRAVADGLPLAPIAKAGEHAVIAADALPMTVGQLAVTLGWIVGASVLVGIGFKWEPGAALPARLAHAGTSARRSTG